MTVRLNDVRKRYGNVVALDGIDVVLDTGITGLLGPNGAGKTTLLRCLATCSPPTRARSRFPGLTPTGPRSAPRSGAASAISPRSPGSTATSPVFDFIDYLAILKEHVDREQRHAEVRRVLELDRALRSGHDQDPQAVWRDETEVGAISGAARVSRLSHPRRANRWSRPRAAVPVPGVGVGAGGGPHRAPLHPPNRRRSGHLRPGDRAQRRPGCASTAIPPG